jgi:DNA-binding transcriptional MerR regulator
MMIDFRGAARQADDPVMAVRYGESRRFLPDSLALTYSIGQLCREFGVTARAVRFYEDKDLLRPARIGPNRCYSERDRERLRLILQGKQLGFSLIEIREILELQASDRSADDKAAGIMDKFRRRLEELRSQRDEIDLAINALTESSEQLQRQLSRRPAGGAGCVRAAAS